MNSPLKFHNPNVEEQMASMAASLNAYEQTAGEIGHHYPKVLTTGCTIRLKSTGVLMHTGFETAIRAILLGNAELVHTKQVEQATTSARSTAVVETRTLVEV
jgi:hypothetical protein